MEEQKKVQLIKQKLRDGDKMVSPEMTTFLQMHAPKLKAFFTTNPDDYTETLIIDINFIKYRVYKYLESKVNGLNLHKIHSFCHQLTSIRHFELYRSQHSRIINCLR